MSTPAGFKRRLGEELALLERARAERAAEEMSGRERPVTARRGLARSGVRRTGLVGLVAGVSVAAFVATSGGQGARSRPAHAVTVAQVLDAAAVNAAKGSDKEPGSHQWVYTDGVLCQSDCGHEPSWIRYDGARSAVIGKSAASGNRTAVLVRDTYPFPTSGKIGEQPRETREVLSRLPTDPRELLARVSTDPFFDVGGAPGQPPARTPWTHGSAWKKPVVVTPGVQFIRILEILKAGPVVPARINAALYQALALIPGTKLVGTPMHDAAGRLGVTLVFDFPGRLRSREYLFLDPRTYAYRGYRLDLNADRGSDYSYALLATGIVDHPGQVPGGPAPAPGNVVVEPPTVAVEHTGDGRAA